MPKKYFTCPDDEKIEIEQCFKKCRFKDRCAELPYLNICAMDRKWSGKPSCTQLIQGTREAYLKIKENYTVNPDDNAFAVVGTRGHSILEKQGDDNKLNILLEEGLEYKGITGKPDILIPYDDGSDTYKIKDYKVSGSWKIAKALGVVEVPLFDNYGKPVLYVKGNKKGKQKKIKQVPDILNINIADIYEWALQLNFYRLAFIEQGFNVIKLEIFAIVRDGRIQISKNRGLHRNTYNIPVPIMAINIVDHYFMDKRDSLINAIDNNYIPEMCTKAECWDGRKCKDYCDVSEFCKNVGDNPYLIYNDDNNYNDVDLTVDPF